MSAIENTYPTVSAARVACRLVNLILGRAPCVNYKNAISYIDQVVHRSNNGLAIVECYLIVMNINFQMTFTIGARRDTASI